MAFASPIWLAGLLPWAGMVVYLLRGRGDTAIVPFLKLWPTTGGTTRLGWRKIPPLWVAMVVAATFLAILAAAGPRWSGGAPAGDISIIIDRGQTMSSDARYHRLLDKCEALLGHQASGSITITAVPGSSFMISDGSWKTTATGLPPTGVDTARDLQIALADRLRLSQGLVIVLSDQAIDRSNPRVVQIMPDSPLRGIGIATLAARSVPTPQVMVRLMNSSARKSVHLRVHSGSITINREVQLRGKFTTEFVDLSKLADTVTASIDGDDDQNIDHAAWLVVQSTGITLDVVGTVPAELRRMAAVFMRDRPLTAGSEHVMISDQPIPPDQMGIQIVQSGEAMNAGRGNVLVLPNAVTQAVTTWPVFAANVKPPAGFDIVVSRQNVPMVAVHEQSPRQVWVNLDVSKWSRTIDFVIFFSNVFDCLKGASNNEFIAISPTPLGPSWKIVDSHFAPVNLQPGLWPGIYQSSDNRLVAVNAEPFAMASIPLLAGDQKLPALMQKEKPLTAAMCEAALIFLAIGLTSRPARRKTRQR